MALVFKRLVCVLRGHQPIIVPEPGFFYDRAYCRYCWAVENPRRPWQNPYRPGVVYDPRHAQEHRT